MLINDSDKLNLVGIEKTTDDISKNKSGLFECNRGYFKTRFGGMQYFNAGLFSMGYIFYKKDENGKESEFPILTGYCEKMALSFQNVIKDTEYFKNINYRLKENPVLKEVLIEYGKVINLSLKGFNECKSLLKETLFSKRVNNQSHQYALFLNNKKNILTNTENARNVLYDYYSIRGDNRNYPSGLKEIINNWEIVIGRQYFAASLELIWKYMLNVLERPKTKKEWIDYCLQDSTFNININDKLDLIVNNCNYSFSDREKMIKSGSSNSKNSNYGMNVENGVKVLLSVYNRFKNKEDLSDNSKQYLMYGFPVSIAELDSIVLKYSDRSIYEFISYIMDK